MGHYRIAGITGNKAKGNSAGKLQILGPKKYILVAGLDYPSNHNQYKLGGSFIDYVRRYKAKITSAKKSSESIIFIEVDIRFGIITTTEIIGSNKPNVTTKVFDAVTKDNYQEADHAFRPNGKINIISKKTIYELIEQIGLDEPNTVYQLDIFSHAYWNGPILVDSLEYSNGVINVDDYDMRISDIVGSIINKTKFGNAFNIDAIVKIWGCSFPQNTNALFSKIRKNKKYSSTEIIADDTIFSYPKDHFYFQLDNKPIVDLTQQINNILKTTFLVNSNIELSFLQIKKIACFNYVNVYAAKLTENVGVKVQSALPATWAEIDPNFHISPTTFANVTFYQKHLGVTLGELNYGIYDKETVLRLTNILNS